VWSGVEAWVSEGDGEGWGEGAAERGGLGAEREGAGDERAIW
jgi:hypothetical protein